MGHLVADAISREVIFVEGPVQTHSIDMTLEQGLYSGANDLTLCIVYDSTASGAVKWSKTPDSDSVLYITVGLST